MKRITRLVLIVMMLFTCTSCMTNKIVYLKAAAPASYENDSIRISASTNQEYWIYFDPDEYSVDESFFIECDEVPDYCRIKSAEIRVGNLGISVTKEIGKDISFDALKTKADKAYRGWFSFEGYFYTQNLVDSWNESHSESVTSLSLYRKFKDVDEVTITLDVEYAIDGTVYAHQYDFSFDTRNVTSSRFWDRMSGV